LPASALSRDSAPHPLDEISVQIDSDGDVVTARQRGRELAAECGFQGSDLVFIATAISEVARNILVYAEHGQIIVRSAEREGSRGIVVVARDEGPGVADVGIVMQDGYSTGSGLGLGLPGARRLMDELEIVSESGRGTTVTMGKWLPKT
jgi:serine/threonine-protein kinase RsbT